MFLKVILRQAAEEQVSSWNPLCVPSVPIPAGPVSGGKAITCSAAEWGSHGHSHLWPRDLNPWPRGKLASQAWAVSSEEASRWGVSPPLNGPLAPICKMRSQLLGLKHSCLETVS